MLFCGDLLRKKISEHAKDKLNYSQFSVSRDAWLELLLSGVKSPEGGIQEHAELEECPLVSVGFITACLWVGRLEGCELIDMVVPLRVNIKNVDGDSCPQWTCVPMLVSIVCQGSLNQQEAEAICNAMTTRAKDSNLKNALCFADCTWVQALRSI